MKRFSSDAAATSSPQAETEAKMWSPSFLETTTTSGTCCMRWVVEFWTKVVNEVCDRPLDSEGEDDDCGEGNPRSDLWRQKWHRKFFEELLLFTHVEYDKANVNRDQYLLSLYPVKDTILANTVSVDVDREIWDNPLWLPGTVSPGETRKKLEVNEAELRHLASLEERSWTQTEYFRSLPDADKYDVRVVRPYAKSLAELWKEILDTWMDNGGLARETHPDVYLKMAIRARRAYSALSLFKERLNILLGEIPDEDVEKEDLRIFETVHSVKASEALIVMWKGDIEKLEQFDSRPPWDAFEWTSI